MDMEQRKKIAIRYGILLLILAACIAGDLLSKVWATHALEGNPPIVLIDGVLELTHTVNENIAFSMLKSIPYPWKDIIIYAFGVIALIFLIYLLILYHKQSIIYQVPLVIILGGALGNRVERIFNGHVVDFIYAHYYHDFSWPVFNVADILIVVGVGWFIIQFLFLPKRHLEK
jgi:signal peptidase II